MGIVGVRQSFGLGLWGFVFREFAIQRQCFCFEGLRLRIRNRGLWSIAEFVQF